MVIIDALVASRTPCFLHLSQASREVAIKATVHDRALAEQPATWQRQLRRRRNALHMLAFEHVIYASKRIANCDSQFACGCSSEVNKCRSKSSAQHMPTMGKSSSDAKASEKGRNVGNVGLRETHGHELGMT